MEVTDAETAITRSNAVRLPTGPIIAASGSHGAIANAIAKGRPAPMPASHAIGRASSRRHTLRLGTRRKHQQHESEIEQKPNGSLMLQPGK